uniref:Uncharacterized protein n=1 Tax=Kotepeofons virus TaxID=3072210 RepID=A0AA96NNS6_9VIRU|nr:MAG: hypothetical protein [Kotepeofons virus]
MFAPAFIRNRPVLAAAPAAPTHLETGPVPAEGNSTEVVVAELNGQEVQPEEYADQSAEGLPLSQQASIGLSAVATPLPADGPVDYPVVEESLLDKLIKLVSLASAHGVGNNPFVGPHRYGIPYTPTQRVDVFDQVTVLPESIADAVARLHDIRMQGAYDTLGTLRAHQEAVRILSHVPSDPLVALMKFGLGLEAGRVALANVLGGEPRAEYNPRVVATAAALAPYTALNTLRYLAGAGVTPFAVDEGPIGFFPNDVPLDESTLTVHGGRVSTLRPDGSWVLGFQPGKAYAVTRGGLVGGSGPPRPSWTRVGQASGLVGGVRPVGGSAVPARSGGGAAEPPRAAPAPVVVDILDLTQLAAGAAAPAAEQAAGASAPTPAALAAELVAAAADLESASLRSSTPIPAADWSFRDEMTWDDIDEKFCTYVREEMERPRDRMQTLISETLRGKHAAQGWVLTLMRHYTGLGRPLSIGSGKAATLRDRELLEGAPNYMPLAIVADELERSGYSFDAVSAFDRRIRTQVIEMCINSAILRIRDQSVRELATVLQTASLAENIASDATHRVVEWIVANTYVSLYNSRAFRHGEEWHAIAGIEPQPRDGYSSALVDLSAMAGEQVNFQTPDSNGLPLPVGRYDVELPDQRTTCNLETDDGIADERVLAKDIDVYVRRSENADGSESCYAVAVGRGARPPRWFTDDYDSAVVQVFSPPKPKVLRDQLVRIPKLRFFFVDFEALNMNRVGGGAAGWRVQGLDPRPKLTGVRLRLSFIRDLSTFFVIRGANDYTLELAAFSPGTIVVDLTQADPWHRKVAIAPRTVGGMLPAGGGAHGESVPSGSAEYAVDQPSGASGSASVPATDRLLAPIFDVNQMDSALRFAPLTKPPTTIVEAWTAVASGLPKHTTTYTYDTFAVATTVDRPRPNMPAFCHGNTQWWETGAGGQGNLQPYIRECAAVTMSGAPATVPAQQYGPGTGVTNAFDSVNEVNEMATFKAYGQIMDSVLAVRLLRQMRAGGPSQGMLFTASMAPTLLRALRWLPACGVPPFDGLEQLLNGSGSVPNGNNVEWEWAPSVGGVANGELRVTYTSLGTWLATQLNHGAVPPGWPVAPVLFPNAVMVPVTDDFFGWTPTERWHWIQSFIPEPMIRPKWGVTSYFDMVTVPLPAGTNGSTSTFLSNTVVGEPVTEALNPNSLIDVVLVHTGYWNASGVGNVPPDLSLDENGVPVIVAIDTWHVFDLALVAAGIELNNNNGMPGIRNSLTKLLTFSSPSDLATAWGVASALMTWTPIPTVGGIVNLTEGAAGYNDTQLYGPNIPAALAERWASAPVQGLPLMGADAAAQSCKGWFGFGTPLMYPSGANGVPIRPLIGEAYGISSWQLIGVVTRMAVNTQSFWANAERVPELGLLALALYNHGVYSGMVVRDYPLWASGVDMLTTLQPREVPTDVIRDRAMLFGNMMADAIARQTDFRFRPKVWAEAVDDALVWRFTNGPNIVAYANLFRQVRPAVYTRSEFQQIAELLGRDADTALNPVTVTSKTVSGEGVLGESLLIRRHVTLAAGGVQSTVVMRKLLTSVGMDSDIAMPTWAWDLEVIAVTDTAQMLAQSAVGAVGGGITWRAHAQRNALRILLRDYNDNQMSLSATPAVVFINRFAGNWHLNVAARVLGTQPFCDLVSAPEICVLSLPNVTPPGADSPAQEPLGYFLVGSGFALQMVQRLAAAKKVDRSGSGYVTFVRGQTAVSTAQQIDAVMRTGARASRQLGAGDFLS